MFVIPIHSNLTMVYHGFAPNDKKMFYKYLKNASVDNTLSFKSECQFFFHYIIIFNFDLLVHSFWLIYTTCAIFIYTYSNKPWNRGLHQMIKKCSTNI